jgi:hypothetical protein
MLRKWFEKRLVEYRRMVWTKNLWELDNLESILTLAKEEANKGNYVPKDLVIARLERIEFNISNAIVYLVELKTSGLPEVTDFLMDLIYASSDVLVLNKAFYASRLYFSEWAVKVRDKMVALPKLCFCDELSVYKTCDDGSGQQRLVLNRMKRKFVNYFEGKELFEILVIRKENTDKVLAKMFSLLGVTVFSNSETIWMYNTMYKLNPNDARLPRLVRQALSWLAEPDRWWKWVSDAYPGSPMEQALADRYLVERKRLLEKKSKH